MENQEQGEWVLFESSVRREWIWRGPWPPCGDRPAPTEWLDDVDLEDEDDD